MTADQPPFRMNQSAYIEPKSPERARKTSGVQNEQADMAVGLFAVNQCVAALCRGHLRHCFDGRRQSALVSSCLVLVNDLLVGDAVHSADGRLVNGLSGGLVAGCNRLDDLLDRGAQFRAQTAVVSILFNCLTCTLAGLCAICHDYSLKIR